MCHFIMPRRSVAINPTFQSLLTHSFEPLSLSWQKLPSCYLSLSVYLLPTSQRLGTLLSVSLYTFHQYRTEIQREEEKPHLSILNSRKPEVQTTEINHHTNLKPQRVRFLDLNNSHHWWMGNCITFQRVVSWVDDSEWNFVESESPRHSTESRKSQGEEPPTVAKSIDPEVLMPSYTESSSVATKPMKPTHEVRVKISKKKLAELLRQAESKGMPVQDVFASIIQTGKPHARHRIGQCWRPGLQSIPEIVE